MAFRGAISRPLFASARSALRSPPSLPRAARSPRLSASRPPRSRLPPFSTPRSLGELGGAMSLLPLHSAVAAARLNSHLSANARACCELSQGRKGKDG